jgi:hypothetical protein
MVVVVSLIRATNNAVPAVMVVKLSENTGAKMKTNFAIAECRSRSSGVHQGVRVLVGELAEAAVSDETSVKA